MFRSPNSWRHHSTFSSFILLPASSVPLTHTVAFTPQPQSYMISSSNTIKFIIIRNLSTASTNNQVTSTFRHFRTLQQPFLQEFRRYTRGPRVIKHVNREQSKPRVNLEISARDITLSRSDIEFLFDRLPEPMNIEQKFRRGLQFRRRSLYRACGRRK
jgi:hypothetical protein